MAEKFLKQYEILFKKAKVDLNTAKLVMDSFEEGEIELDLEIVMFHLQQSVEKFLKTLIDYNKIKFPHTHDIEDAGKYIKFIDNLLGFVKEEIKSCPS